MPKKSLERSRTLGPTLRRRRQELGLSIQDVVDATEKSGRPIPYSTLAKIETGEVDPGVLRFHQLLKVYQLPMQTVQDLLDLEEITAPFVEDGDAEDLLDQGRALMERGQIGAALARYVVARQKAPKGSSIRARATLAFTGTCCALGKFRLALHALEEVILDPLEARIRVTAYVQAAICWDGLGSPDAALGFLERGETHLPRGDARVRAWLYHKKASALSALGRLADASRDVERAARAYRAAGDAFGFQQLAGLRIRLARESGRLEASVRMARRARREAREGGYERLEVHRAIDEAAALVGLGRAEPAVALLESCLARALVLQDRPAQFLIHYHLWRAFESLETPLRARAERDAARYFVRFVDESTRETRDIKEEVRDGQSKS